jgi:hypothetical protein
MCWLKWIILGVRIWARGLGKRFAMAILRARKIVNDKFDENKKTIFVLVVSDCCRTERNELLAVVNTNDPLSSASVGSVYKNWTTDWNYDQRLCFT